MASTDNESKIYWSEGFPCMGYLVPARDAPGVLPDVESSWDAAIVVAVIWKMPKYGEMLFFSQIGMPNKSRNANFWGEKQKRRKPNVEQSYLRKSKTCLSWIHIFERTSQKVKQKLYFDGTCQVEIKQTDET